jgi:hypothetical protein
MWIYCIVEIDTVVRDSSVGIATHYGLDGPGIESQCPKFLASLKNGRQDHPAIYTLGTGLFQGGKAAGACRWPTTPFSAEIKEYSHTSNPLWALVFC